jgi:TetR/AcrR family transcriptional regulator, cholesterol catabolism regulator
MRLPPGKSIPNWMPHYLRLLVLGALGWVAEWWDPRRGSVDDIAAKAQLTLRSGPASNASPAA